jgi:hypothetical protein
VTLAYKCPSLVPNLNQINHSTTYYTSYRRSVLKLPSYTHTHTHTHTYLYVFQIIPFLQASDKNFVRLFCPMRATFLIKLTLLDLISLTIFGKMRKLRQYSLVYSLQPCAAFCDVQFNKFEANNILSRQKYSKFLITCWLMSPTAHFSGDDRHGTWCNEGVEGKSRNSRNSIFPTDRHHVYQ